MNGGYAPLNPPYKVVRFIKTWQKSQKIGNAPFEGLEKDTYKITAKKKGYRKSKQSVELEEGEVEEGVEIVMKKR